MFNTDFTFENSVCYENLNILSKRQTVEIEKRICEINELVDGITEIAASLCSDGYSIYEILLAITGECKFHYVDSCLHALCENIPYIKSYLKSLCARDTAVFSSILTDKLNKLNVPTSESDFLFSNGDEQTFVYLRNSLADEAYDVFSQDFSDPRVSYVSSFREAARTVSRGEAEFCLLPLEEKGGARLSAIASVLFDEDLKINSVTPVFGPDGSADMKYALCSRHFSVPPIYEDDDRYLELRISAKRSDVFSNLLLAAEAFDISVYRINTVSFKTDDGIEPYFIIVFKSNGGSFSKLLVYLTLFCSSYTAIGIYKNLE